jgi:hypothetical protein
MGRRRRETLKLKLLALVLLCAAGGTIPALLLHREQAELERASETWPTTQGTVVSSKLHASTSGRGKRSWEVLAQYEYRIDGAVHRSGMIGYYTHTSFDDKADAEELVARYALGSQVVVHYDPTAPDRAVLDITGYEVGTRAAWAFGILGVLCAAAGIACIVRVLRTR